MLRRTDFNWLTVRLFGAWLGSVVILLLGVRYSFRPVTDNPAAVAGGYAVLLFGFLLMGAWFRWCTRVSALEAAPVCDNCIYLERMEEAVDELDVEVQERIRNYQRTAQTDLDRLHALADGLHQEAVTGDQLLTHDQPLLTHVPPVASEKDTGGRHWRRP